MIDCARFYLEWKGHPIDDLTIFRNVALTKQPGKTIVYLAGDSSLDNKHWVDKTSAIVPSRLPAIYEKAFKKPCAPKPDVAFWMNSVLKDHGTCVNAAVEESVLRDRDTVLLPHDEFIRDNIRSNDVLIVSIGANDIALNPNSSTIRNMLQLAWLTPRKNLENGTASALQYFKHMFGTQTQDYITRLWADTQLKALGYNSYPGQLQATIRAIYEIATKEIQIEGTETVPCALHEVLDGKTADEYTARVEPNERGGRKMAVRFVELLNEILEKQDALEAG